MTQKILVPLDLSHVHKKVLDTARDLAGLHEADLMFLTVLPVIPAIVGVYMPDYDAAKAEQEAIAAMKEQLSDKGLETEGYEFAVRHGSPYDEILKYQEAVGADLIVIGSHAPSAADYLLGSTAAKTVRHAPCSVFVVRGMEG